MLIGDGENKTKIVFYGDRDWDEKCAMNDLSEFHIFETHNSVQLFFRDSLRKDENHAIIQEKVEEFNGHTEYWKEHDSLVAWFDNSSDFYEFCYYVGGLLILNNE